ncbi:MauE/DoxX family redox-associated membrane protein [Alkalibaculum bacchi]|uniref:MauE/DoxX family redox-associated membrane protein n=1 Tax=Alkalibaculum bacchi TaxID=645887 RepID=UPI00350E3831
MSIRGSSEFAENLGIFPPKIGSILGFFMPFVELFVGLGLLLFTRVYILVIAYGIIFFFLALNMKFILERKEMNCFCYGNILESKLGKGGFIHYIYLLVALGVGSMSIDQDIIKVIYNVDSINLVFVILTMLLLAANSIIIQLVIDKA